MIAALAEHSSACIADAVENRAGSPPPDAIRFAIRSGYSRYCGMTIACAAASGSWKKSP
jgi:hypothetical protein